MTTEETIQQIAQSPAGREHLLTHVATTESAAILVLDEILKDLEDPRLRKMAKRHRADEVRHAAMLAGRLRELGIEPDLSKATASVIRLEQLWRTLAPSTIPEKYAVLQVIEEQDCPLFGVLSEALRPYDSRTADIFERMGKDEASHVRFCHVIARELGDEASAIKLEEYRIINAALRAPIDVRPPVTDVPREAQIEVYRPERHFDMIQSWGAALDADTLGNGLVLPGLCCGFVDGIGYTRTAYFYCLRANPALPMIGRGRAILRLAPHVLQAARDAGYTAVETSTSNAVVERWWVRTLGLKGSYETVLKGAL